jgi:glycosyltransferase involved in cell wall biosynthesis
MSILHVITSLHTGGAETLVVNLIPHFIDLGYEVGVVVFNGEETPLMKKLLHDCPDCKLYKLGHSYYNPFYIIKLIWIMRKYDIIHTHNSSPQLFVAIANIFYRKKIVTTEHNTNNRKRNYWLLSMIDN